MHDCRERRFHCIVPRPITVAVLYAPHLGDIGHVAAGYLMYNLPFPERNGHGLAIEVEQ
jgi:hypothetical protein